MSELRPLKVPLAEAPLQEHNPSFRFTRLIEPSRSGSDLMFGLLWFDAGGEPVSWTPGPETHETYYVLSGRVRISWDGADSGSEELAPQDGFFFPPGRDYTVESVGDEQAFVAWAVRKGTTT